MVEKVEDSKAFNFQLSDHKLQNNASEKAISYYQQKGYTTLVETCSQTGSLFFACNDKLYVVPSQNMHNLVANG